MNLVFLRGGRGCRLRSRCPGLEVRAGQDRDVEPDRVGVGVAVERAGDVMVVRLRGAGAGTSQTTITLEVGKVDHVDFQGD